MAYKHSAVSYQEENVLCLLSVKVIKAADIPWADWMSNADCYVCLWLPTCTNRVLKTKTISNTSDPVWNETFYYTFCSSVKNVLHLTLHDEDVVSGNDLLYTVAFDVEKIKCGETKEKTFTLKPEGPETLQVEFTVEQLPDKREKFLTNGVVVEKLDIFTYKTLADVYIALQSRQMSCLQVSVDKHGIPKNLQGKQLVLSVEDSCEKMYKIELSPTSSPDYTNSYLFHCMRNWNPELTVYFEGEEDQSLQIIPMRALTAGQEQKIQLLPVQDKPLDVKLKVKDCINPLDVRLGFGLCDDENLFLSKRRKVVADTLKKVLKLDRDLEEHEIPVIGVTTTGGGVRAMTSLYGTLSGLKKLNLLDCVSYITGASGSTWTLSKLYQDPNWSQTDLTGPIEDARRNVAKSKISAFSFDRLAFYREEMGKRAKLGYKTSFTDIWGLLLESMFCTQVNDTKLTDQRKALSHGQNPLPLCLAMNVKAFENSTLDFKEWCEFSPYEVGLLQYGAFIRSEDFGSEFFMGRRTKILPESRICYLQGLWSNIFSINLMDAWFAATSSEHLWHRFTRDYVHDLDEEEAILKKRTEPGLATRLLQPAGTFSRGVREILTNRPIDGEHHNFLRGLQMHAEYSVNNDFCVFTGGSKGSFPPVRMFVWTRGKVGSYVPSHCGDQENRHGERVPHALAPGTVLGDTELNKSPNKLTPSTDQLCLVDSAYYINASFPPLLREERKVDVMLSFDYGLSDKFKSVVRTQKYCAEQNIPFPKVELSEEDRKNPKECYIFSDSENPDVPMILHFPLVNDTFEQFIHPGVERRTEEEKKEGTLELSGIMSPYRLFHLTYSEENFNKLLNLTEYNVENNEEAILQALRDAIAHKQKHRTSYNI